MGKGWIKLYRQLQDCPIWYGERFSKGQAWVDLLMLANHSEKKIMFNGKFLIVKKGQYLTSTVKLSEKWKWNRKTVSSFLKLLENDNMITKVSDNTKTLITIVNYSIYQSETKSIGQPNGQPIVQQWDNPLDTNKNDKNVRMKEYISGDGGVIDIYACAKDIAYDLIKKYWSREPTEMDIDNVYGLIIKVNVRERSTSIDENKKELLEYAFQSSSNANAMNWNYVNGVMSQLRTRGIKTIDEAYEFDIQRKSES